MDRVRDVLDRTTSAFVHRAANTEVPAEYLLIASCSKKSRKMHFIKIIT